MTYQRPSDAWTSTWPAGEEGYREARACLANLNCAHLEKIALATRKAQSQDPCDTVDLECTIDASRFDGTSLHIMLEVAFSDGTYWLARVDTFPPHKGDHTIMLSELATMKVLKERTLIPVPAVYAHSALPSDDFAYPFVLLEWLPGRHVDTPFYEFPENRLEQLGKQLAEILHQLAKLRFDTLGRIWCGENLDTEPRIIPSMSLQTGEVPDPYPRTSFEWYESERQAACRRALQHCNWVRKKLKYSSEYREALSRSGEGEQALIRSVARRSDWKAASAVRQDAVTRIIARDQARGPFPLCHSALNPSHMLFDEDLNITGIIQWKYAQTMPFEQLTNVPTLYCPPSVQLRTSLTDPGATRDESAPLPDLMELAREPHEAQKTEAQKTTAHNHLDRVTTLAKQLLTVTSSIEDAEVRSIFDSHISQAGMAALEHSMDRFKEVWARPKRVISAIEDTGFEVEAADGTIEEFGGNSEGVEAIIKDIDCPTRSAEGPELKWQSFRNRKIVYLTCLHLRTLEDEWRQKHDVHGPAIRWMEKHAELHPTELFSLFDTQGQEPCDLVYLSFHKSVWAFIPNAKRMLELMHDNDKKVWDSYTNRHKRDHETAILGLGGSIRLDTTVHDQSPASSLCKD